MHGVGDAGADGTDDDNDEDYVIISLSCLFFLSVPSVRSRTQDQRGLLRTESRYQHHRIL